MIETAAFVLGCAGSHRLRAHAETATPALILAFSLVVIAPVSSTLRDDPNQPIQVRGVP